MLNLALPVGSFRMLLCTAAVLFAGPAFCLDTSVAARTNGQLLAGSSLWASTHLIELRQGSELSSKVGDLAGGGYELSDGRYQSFRGWYSSVWKDARVTWLTQVNNNFGIIWGFSTGERGKKYTIHPSLKLGFIAQAQAARNVTIALKATTILGGALREKSCTADYGEIGGVQEVNCRFAATLLQPSETLAYLANEKPLHKTQIALTLDWKF